LCCNIIKFITFLNKVGWKQILYQIYNFVVDDFFYFESFTVPKFCLKRSF
jgi:hypothetical protein